MQIKKIITKIYTDVDKKTKESKISNAKYLADIYQGYKNVRKKDTRKITISYQILLRITYITYKITLMTFNCFLILKKNNNLRRINIIMFKYCK